MFRSLRFRLLLMMIIVAMVALGTVALFAHQTTTNEDQQITNLVRSGRLSALERAGSAHYEPELGSTEDVDVS